MNSPRPALARFLAPVLSGLAAAALLASLTGCGDVSEPKSPVYKTGIPAEEIKSKAFSEQFPLQYQSYQNNKEDTFMSDYAGSVPWDKATGAPLPKPEHYAQPYLKNLWLGYPFSYEYRAARGHTYAIDDILHIDRINNYSEKAGLPATCWNCKTTTMPKWLGEYGDKFWTMEFHDFRTKLDVNENSIGCTICHEPQSMKLRLTSAPLNDYLSRAGKDPEKLSRNEMRALVCAQCHVEYYFTDKNLFPEKAARPVFPWDDGFTVEAIYTYYNTHGSVKDKGFEGKFADWVHPVSKTPMIKVQHPEYETWIDGSHGAAGVTCADCHMPYTRVDGKKKISQHQWASPLKNIDRACRQCHTDKTPEYLKERVVFTQEKVFAQLLKAQEESVRAHEAVRLALEWKGEKGPDQEKSLIEAKEMVRKGQFFWDFVSAENSVGFHNPSKALDTLAKSLECSRKAVDAALRASNYEIAKGVNGEVKSLVPPIMRHSRELQMSPEHLASHKWLTYLPLTPKAARVWDGQKKLTPAAAQ